jgi:hypothetical protein
MGIDGEEETTEELRFTQCQIRLGTTGINYE